MKNDFAVTNVIRSMVLKVVCWSMKSSTVMTARNLFVLKVDVHTHSHDKLISKDISIMHIVCPNHMNVAMNHAHEGLHIRTRCMPMKSVVIQSLPYHVVLWDAHWCLVHCLPEKNTALLSMDVEKYNSVHVENCTSGGLP